MGSGSVSLVAGVRSPEARDRSSIDGPGMGLQECNRSAPIGDLDRLACFDAAEVGARSLSKFPHADRCHVLFVALRAQIRRALDTHHRHRTRISRVLDNVPRIVRRSKPLGSSPGPGHGVADWVRASQGVLSSERYVPSLPGEPLRLVPLSCARGSPATDIIARLWSVQRWSGAVVGST